VDAEEWLVGYRARLTDLGNQKASILRMLAALEKTRRGIDG